MGADPSPAADGLAGRNELCLHRLHDAWRAGLGLPTLSRSLVDA